MATQKIEFKDGSLGTRDKILRPGVHYVDDQKFPELVELARNIKGVKVTQEDEKTEVASEPKLLASKAVTESTEPETPKSDGTDKPLATGGIIEGNSALLISDNDPIETVTPLVAKPTARTAAKRGRPRKTAVAA